MKKGICKLCDKKRKLCNSHILSEFLYKSIYDENHQFLSLVDHPKIKTRPIQKGAREYLLCKSCEDQFNTYETYSSDLLRKVKNKDIQDDQVTLPQYNYTKLKLFGFSLFWRCHVADIISYQKISLGPHGKKLKKLLANEDPGDPKEYCFILIRLDGSEIGKRVITTPSRTRFHGLNSMFFFALGFCWILITSNRSHEIPDYYNFVGASKELKIPVMNMTEKEFLKQIKPAYDRMKNS